MERVLALDFSSKCVGWSIFDNGEPIAQGKELQVGDGHGEKLYRFVDWLRMMFGGWKPDVVVYEAPYAGRMRHAFAVLNKYVAAIDFVHWEYYGKEVETSQAVPSHVVKRTIKAPKGKNHEDNKRIMVKLMNETYGLGLKFKEHDTTRRYSDDDVADALAVNTAWHALHRKTDVG